MYIYVYICIYIYMYIYIYIYDKQIILKIICTLVQDPLNTIYTFEETQTQNTGVD